MGNTCGCTEDRKAGDAGQGNISQPVKKIAPNAFVQPTVQSKFTPASFSQLPPGDKDQLLADVFKLIALNGDLSRVKSTNAHVKTLLSKSSAKFIHESRDQYDGEVVEGLASGKGKAIYASDASTYEGNFLAGYEFGEGTVKHPNGDVDHCQTFNRGLQHGICHKISKDKAEMISVCKNGECHGPMVINQTNLTTYAYYKDNREDGIEVTVSKDRKKCWLTEFKQGVIAKKEREFVPAVISTTGAAVPTPTTGKETVKDPIAKPPADASTVDRKTK